jgi:hypothetical protein
MKRRRTRGPTTRPNAYELLPGGLVRIALSKGFSTLIDASDLEYVLRHRWHAICPSGNGRRYYAAARTGGRSMYLHRYLLPHDQLQTDHVNGDTLDNRRANLRSATPAQNAAGYQKRVNKTSQYRGVSWSAKDQRWVGGVTHHGQTVTKQFRDEEEAARWRDEQARLLHGAFAHLNFPVLQ